MALDSRVCSVCGVPFEVHFRYQLEAREERTADGRIVRREVAYCSQRCLEASHRERVDGLVSCHACAKRFRVELAAQVVFTGGMRHYACDAACRARILEAARAVRLGQLLDPGYGVNRADGVLPEPRSADPLARLTLSLSSSASPTAPTPPVPGTRPTPPPKPVRPPTTAPPSAPTASPVPPSQPAASIAPMPIVTPPASVPASVPQSAPQPATIAASSVPPTANSTSAPAARPTTAVAVPLVPSPAAPANGAPSASSSRPSSTPHVLAVFNHKGGTGKTTTAVHVAAGLAARGRRVLLIDTDGQGNVATSLGISFERSLYHVIVMRLDVRGVIVSARPGLDLVPADETLAAAELYLAGQKQRDRVLASRFQEVRGAYDFVVVDCSPSLSLLNQNALVMADAVLCPVACDYLSLVGVRQVVRTVKQVNRLLSHRLQFWGVLPTFFDGRARICHDVVAALRQHFGEVCLDPVRITSRVKEAPAQGKTLFEYAPGSTAAEDYSRVVERLLLAPEKNRDATRTAMGAVA